MSPMRGAVSQDYSILRYIQLGCVVGWSIWASGQP